MDEDDAVLFRDLRTGTRFQGVFAARGVRTGDGNGPRVQMTLADRSGDTRRAILWQATAEQIAALHAAPLLWIDGTLSAATEKYPSQVTVEAFQPVEETPGLVAAFLPPLPDDHEETRRRFDALLRSVANPHLAALLRSVFGSEAFRRRFEDAVAAGKHHHAYRGGLMRHTVEVAELCRAASRTIPRLRHDLLVAAALLHDTGKIWEMDHGLRAGEYTTSGTLIGHIHDGAFRIELVIARDKTFPSGLREALLHLLLSHHERPEWGSPKTPSLPEAVVLAQCDRISAHATEFLDAADAALPGQTSLWRGDRIVFVGDLGLGSLDLSGLSDEELGGADGDSPSLTADDLVLPPAFDVANLLSLPVRGLVAAGDGERSSEEPEDTGEQVVAAAPPGGADYVVCVIGESMVGAGILQGDRAYVRHQETAWTGDVVIAYVPGSGNVIKRFHQSPRGTFLVSENPDRAAYPPIPVTEGVRIQGVVTRVERDLAGRR